MPAQVLGRLSAGLLGPLLFLYTLSLFLISFLSLSSHLRRYTHRCGAAGRPFNFIFIKVGHLLRRVCEKQDRKNSRGEKKPALSSLVVLWGMLCWENSRKYAENLQRVLGGDLSPGEGMAEMAWPLGNSQTLKERYVFL